MSKSSTIKFLYENKKITIRTRYNKFYLDFVYNNKRVKKSTGLIANDTNLKHIKMNVIPQILETLTDNSSIEYLNKDILFNDFAKYFFNTYKNTVRNHIYESNYSIYKKHIEPCFSDFNIDEIKPIKLEEWQNNLLNKYSVNSVIRYRSILNLILKKAFDNDIIKINPLEKIKYPSSINKKFKKLNELDETDIYPFNRKEIVLILKEAKGNLYYFIYLMLSTGMRPGEIIPLTWNDINFDKKRIAVDKTIIRGKIGDVKTQSSVRYVDILPTLESKLKELQQLNISSKYLFISNYKKPFNSHTVIARRFKKLLSKLKIKERNLYNLRHTFASIMISEGQNILWISKMLGHKNISITLKVYAKFIKEDDKKRIDSLSKINIAFMEESI